MRCSQDFMIDPGFAIMTVAAFQKWVTEQICKWSFLLAQQCSRFQAVTDNIYHL